MAVSASYLSDLSRVRVSFSGMSTDADYATVERSTDGGFHWELVRGGSTVPVTAGAGHLDDYEFANGELNTYRVTAIDSAVIQATAAGTYTTANNASVVPPLPAGILAGNMMILTATHQNTAATVNTPAGWTLLPGGASHFATFYRTYQVGDTAPTVTFSGGSAGQSCSAVIRGFTNASAPVHLTTQTNASAQNVAYPGTSQSFPGIVFLLHEWKQSTGTGASKPLEMNPDPWGGFNTAGASAESQVIWRTVANAWHTVMPGVSEWTGGVAAISKSRLMYMLPRSFTNQETTSITPVENRVVITNLGRPSLAIFPELVAASEITRRSRAGIFDVQGRTLPVSVLDVQGSREFTVEIDLFSFDNIADADVKLSSGAPLMLRMPPGDNFLPTCYVVLGDWKLRQDAKGSESMTIELPMTEVAKPGDAVYGDTYIWADVIADYATWSDVLADPQNTSWSNLIDHVGDAEVIVP